MSPLPDRMTVHWWWRPGLRPGRRLLVWHILPAGHPDVRSLAGAYHHRLAEVDGLDVVPTRWIHLTTQVVGFADELADGVVAAMVAGVRRRLRPFRPVTVELDRPLPSHTEAVALGTRPGGALDHVRRAVREAVEEAGTVPPYDDGPGWAPHLAVAYSNREAPAAPIARALTPPPAPRPMTVDALHLVSQVRRGHRYEWRRLASAPLAG